MTDIATVIDTYIATWNESDPARRRRLIAETWSDEATYVDPLMSGEGHSGIDAMIAGAQEQFPGRDGLRATTVTALCDGRSAVTRGGCDRAPRRSGASRT